MRFLSEPSCWINVGGIKGHKGVWCLIRWKGVTVRWVSSALLFVNFVSFVIASYVCVGSSFADCDVVFGGFDLTSVNLTSRFMFV